MLAQLIKFTGISVLNTKDIPCIFDDSNLHTETNTEVWYLIFSGIFSGKYHTLNTTAAETARNKNAVKTGKHLFNIFGCDFFRVDPVNTDMGIVIISGVA